MASRAKSFVSSAASSITGGGLLDNFKSNYAKIGIFVLVALVIGVVIYYGYTYLSKKFKVGYKENNENISSGGSNGECELLFFSTSWCPYCKTAKPIWEEVKNEYKDRTVNGNTIIFTDVDCTNESPEVAKMMDRYKIEGFPTIKLIKGGQVIDFDAKVTKENLEQFINTAI